MMIFSLHDTYLRPGSVENAAEGKKPPIAIVDLESMRD